MNELLQLMHDTVSKIGTIKSSAQLLKVGQNKQTSDFLIEAIIIRADELQALLDDFYRKQKRNN
jgi:nitrogen-specific signal transduction histidine kinase